jgi:hypothetical protein
MRLGHGKSIIDNGGKLGLTISHRNAIYEVTKGEGEEEYLCTVYIPESQIEHPRKVTSSIDWDIFISRMPRGQRDSADWEERR